jgi:hypothetical protein
MVAGAYSLLNKPSPANRLWSLQYLVEFFVRHLCQIFW